MNQIVDVIMKRKSVRSYEERQSRLVKIKSMMEQGITNVAQATYVNKFSAGFSVEMRRSVREILKVWLNELE